MQDEHLEKLINRLVVETDPTEVVKLYAQWAGRYDNDLNEFGYVAPQLGLLHLRLTVLHFRSID